MGSRVTEGIMMPTQSRDLDRIRERLEILESLARRLERIALSLAVLGAVVFVAWIASARPALSGKPQTHTVETSRLVLKDASGSVRAILATDADATYLEFKDTAGRKRIELRLSEAGPFLSLDEAEGVGGVELSTIGGVAEVHLSGDGESHAWLRVPREGPPALSLEDTAHKVEWSAP